MRRLYSLFEPQAVSLWVACVMFLTLFVGAPNRLEAREALPPATGSSQKWDELSRRPQWRKLLHWVTDWAEGHSQADGRGFFFSPQGRVDARAELEATINGFLTGKISEEQRAALPAAFHDDVVNSHPQCLFPARFAWLKSELGWSEADVPTVNCPKWKTFQERVAPVSATLVFSSYYLNNPASAFGHTFIRLNKGGAGPRQELLDYGMNYSATVTTANPVFYAFLGVAGGFRGEFTSVPYYYKVREYNDSESRDLWEYELQLSKNEVDRLLAHIWELGSTFFYYWYLDENCSYHMLSLLEAAAPQLNLVTQLSPVVVPADTVRVVGLTPGLVKSVHFRPAIRTVFQARWNALSSAEQDAVERWTEGLESGKIPEKEVTELDLTTVSQTTASQARVLDAALDLIDMKEFKRIAAGDETVTRYRNTLLGVRAQLGAITESPEVLKLLSGAEATQAAGRPDSGHGTRRLTVAAGLDPRDLERNIVPAFTASYRLALHDLSDPDRGYPKDAQIEFLHTRATLRTAAPYFRLDQVDLIRVLSLKPLDRMDSAPSWGTRLGVASLPDARCDRCLALTGELGGGATVTLWDSLPKAAELPGGAAAALFALVEGEFAWAPGNFEGSKVRLGLGPRLGARVSVLGRWSVAASMYRRWYLPRFKNDSTRGYLLGTIESRWALNREWAAAVRVDRSAAGWSGFLGASFYY